MPLKHAPFKHLCANQAKLISKDAELGRRYWSMFMSRGRSAYSDCRWDGADVYLSAAIDVAVVRLSSRNDRSFSFCHVLEPLNLLCRLYSADQRPDEGKQKIDYVRQLLAHLASPTFIHSVLDRFSTLLSENSENETECDVSYYQSLTKRHH